MYFLLKLKKFKVAPVISKNSYDYKVKGTLFTFGFFLKIFRIIWQFFRFSFLDMQIQNKYVKKNY